jgi:hypothetical protein
VAVTGPMRPMSILIIVDAGAFTTASGLSVG